MLAIKEGIKPRIHKQTNKGDPCLNSPFYGAVMTPTKRTWSPKAIGPTSCSSQAPLSNTFGTCHCSTFTAIDSNSSKRASYQAQISITSGMKVPNFGASQMPHLLWWRHGPYDHAEETRDATFHQTNTEFARKSASEDKDKGLHQVP